MIVCEEGRALCRGEYRCGGRSRCGQGNAFCFFFSYQQIQHKDQDQGRDSVRICHPQSWYQFLQSDQLYSESQLREGQSLLASSAAQMEASIKQIEQKLADARARVVEAVLHDFREECGLEDRHAYEHTVQSARQEAVPANLAKLSTQLE